MAQQFEAILLEAVRETAVDWTNNLCGWPGDVPSLVGVSLIFIPGEEVWRAGLFLRQGPGNPPLYQLCRGRRGGIAHPVSRRDLVDLFSPPLRKWLIVEGGTRFVRSVCGMLLVEQRNRPSILPDLN